MNTAKNNTELLELYKLHAELADRVSQRREGANRLYVSLLTGFFVTLVALSRFGSDKMFAESSLFVAGGLLGFLLSISWYIVIRSYRQLNSGKFKALDELEEKLEYPFFRREWQMLEAGKNYNKYWKLTTAETALLVIFGIAFLGLVIYAFCL